MPRPICDERVTIRLPKELLADCLDMVGRMHHPSLSAYVCNALENENARLATYRIDYYTHFRGLVKNLLGDNV